MPAVPPEPSATAESLPPPSSDRPLRGGCLCGAIRFQVTRPFVTASYCHCTHCQRRTGTASSANGRVERAGFELLSGRDLLRSYRPGVGLPKLFCGVCGSALFSGDPESDAEVRIRLGALDGDPGIRPQYRQFVRSAVSWEPLPDDGLPRHSASAELR